MNKPAPTLTIVIAMPDEMAAKFEDNELISSTLTVNANTMEITYEDEDKGPVTRSLTEIDVKAIGACLIWGGINKDAADAAHAKVSADRPTTASIRIF